jgi:hypothetical protein
MATLRSALSRLAPGARFLSKGGRGSSGRNVTARVGTLNYPRLINFLGKPLFQSDFRLNRGYDSVILF